MKTRVAAVICLTTLMGACLVELPDPINIRDMLVSSAFDGKITAKVENGNDYNAVISTVAARIYNENSGKYEVFASGSYANGGFTITLPATPNAKFLISLGEVPAGITISDKTAKAVSVNEFTPLDSKGYSVGDLYYAKDDRYSGAVFMYADRDVTITGSYRNEIQVNFSMLLKKGWNIVYEEAYNSSYNLTTMPVSGLKWYFEEDFYPAITTISNVKMFCTLVDGSNLSAAASVDGSLYALVSATTSNRTKIDFVYFYGKMYSPNSIASATGTFSNMTNGWAKKNDTRFVLLSGVDFATVTAENIVSIAGLPTATSVAVSNGAVVGFVTDAGKIGIFKVVDYKAGYNVTDYCTIDIKVQQ